MSVHGWSLPFVPPTLADNEVHVWRASLEQPPMLRHRLLETLSADERERAGRFHFAKDRDHFVVARSVLRVVLGGYLGRDPAGLRFRYGPRGKPALADPCGAAPLCFNVSHSHGLALVAATRSRAIGVDVERIRTELNVEGVERLFSPCERAALRALAGDEHCRAFFACWTRKEAYLKARGEGLFLPLGGFAVSVLPGAPAALLACDGDAGERERWSLSELAPDPAYAAALAVEGRGWRLRCWQWAVDEAGAGPARTHETPHVWRAARRQEEVEP